MSSKIQGCLSELLRPRHKLSPMSPLKEAEEGRNVLRLINRRVNDLRKHVASQVQMFDNRLTIQFEPTVDYAGVFCIQLREIVGFVDRGLLFKPLTAGLVWDMAGPFGRENALDVGYEDTAGLIELRLDYQAEKLHCRFQAVARAATAWDGPVPEERSLRPFGLTRLRSGRTRAGAGTGRDQKLD